MEELAKVLAAMDKKKVKSVRFSDEQLTLLTMNKLWDASVNTMDSSLPLNMATEITKHQCNVSTECTKTPKVKKRITCSPMLAF